MLFCSLLVALVASVVGASAQLATTIVNGITCTPTAPAQVTSTIADVTTSTYCPVCFLPTRIETLLTHTQVCDEAKVTGGVYTSIYETQYLAICPTGLTTSTYTVTAECTGTTPINHATVPAGFTAVATICTACSGGTSIYTVTVPISNAQALSATVVLALTSTAGNPVAAPASPSAPVVGTPTVQAPAASTPVVKQSSVVATMGASVVSVPAVKVLPTTVPAGASSSAGSATNPAPVEFTGAASSIKATAFGTLAAAMAGMLIF